MNGLRVGFAICGSFCTFEAVLPEIKRLVEAGADVYPILSETAYGTDTRFGRAREWQERITAITGREIIHTIAQAEPIGPKALLDVVVVAPCTGNTLAKLAGGIADTSVTMACKAHLRNLRPVVLAISTNDGLAGAARNIGDLMARKNIYFVPYRQDDSAKKPNSLVADMTRIADAVRGAAAGDQLQPVLLSPLS